MKPRSHWQTPLTHVPRPLHSSLSGPPGQPDPKNLPLFSRVVRFVDKQSSWVYLFLERKLWLFHCSIGARPPRIQRATLSPKHTNLPKNLLSDGAPECRCSKSKLRGNWKHFHMPNWSKGTKLMAMINTRGKGQAGDILTVSRQFCKIYTLPAWPSKEQRTK